MNKPFESSREGEQWFIHSLTEKGYEITQIKDVRILSGRGRVITQKLVEVNSGEAFQVAFWTKLCRLIDTDDLRMDFAKERDKKLKIVLRTFGFGDEDVLGLQMSAVLNLIELETKGTFAHLVFLIKDGRCLWCRAREFYEFVLRYDSFLEQAPTYGGEFCIVPVKWLKDWNNLPNKTYPTLLEGKIYG